MSQLGLNIQASRKLQTPAATIHDLNDKKISELTQEEAKQVREEWDVHFNDLDYRDGRFKFAPQGGLPERFHDKADAITKFFTHNGGATLFDGKRILHTRDK